MPNKSAEFGHDADVQRAVADMFSPGKDGKPRVTTNTAGGTAVFLPRAAADTLREALDDAWDVYDVEFASGKELRYIHKVVGGKDVFFFANLQKQPLTTVVRLRGKKIALEAWNPHDGKISKLQLSHKKEGSKDVTEITLKLSPIESIFVVGR